MPQSLSRMVVHVVFSTRERTCYLDDRIGTRVHAYLAAVTRDCGCEAYRVGGTRDHVHLGILLPRDLALADLLRQLKSTSSAWIKTLGPDYAGFAWQRGYGAFSVSFSRLAVLLRYIAKQAEHHRRVSFQDEFRLLLRRHGIEWDERYVWD